jgi:trans-aconitate methyltransferase
VDVGGGDSRLVDYLLERGLACISVLDVSGAALARAQQRLGPHADRVEWIESDVTGDWSVSPRDIWHDRAVFHFLTDAADRAAYLSRLHETVKPGGSVVLATFAPTGPERCSGLPVQRYSPADLERVLGSDFALVEDVSESHRTSSGTIQDFTYARLVRV